MKVENLLPEVYYKESRDFSYIGRLLEIILNYMKMQADLSRTAFYDEKVNKNLILLLAKTVGFETKHEYLSRDLLFIAQNFNDLVRRKGTAGAVLDAVKILAMSQNLSLPVDENNSLLVDQNKKVLQIVLPYTISDVELFEDLLNYLLPAGWLYEIVYTNKSPTASGTNIPYDNVAHGYKYASKNLGRVYGSADVVGKSGNTVTDENQPAGNDIPRATWYTGQIVTSATGLSQNSKPDA